MSALFGSIELVAGWMNGKFKIGVSYVGRLLFLEECRQVVSASLSLDPTNQTVQQVLAYIGAPDSKEIVCYESEHFTHIQKQSVEDQLTTNGGVAFLVGIDNKSIWVWHPDPRYMPTVRNERFQLLMSRVCMNGEFCTRFYEGFEKRMEAFCKLKGTMSKIARP